MGKDFTCPICGKSKVKRIDHVYNCNDGSYNNVDLRYNVLLQCYPMLDITYVYDKYINNEWSLPDFKKSIGISYRDTQFLLEYYNIPQRTLKDSVTLNRCKSKSKNTVMSKYGVDNVSKHIDIKNKKRDSSIKTYGVDNPFKAKEIIDKIRNDEYYLATYGMTFIQFRRFHAKKYWASLSDDDKRTIINNNGLSRLDEFWLKREGVTYDIIEHRRQLKAKSNLQNTRIEQKIMLELEELGYTYNRQYPISYGSKRYYYDFYLPDMNLVVEVNGDFWHANPIMYKHNDILKFPGTDGVIASDIWKKDLHKKKVCLDNNHDIIYIWENEIQSDFNLLTYIKDVMCGKLENI